NLFGKWCRPNYNSAIATFCNNIAQGLSIQVNDPSVVMHLAYIDDVVSELLSALTGDEHREGNYCAVPTVHTITLGEIATLIRSFRESRTDLSVPNTSDPFTKKLYAT
ncbi:MAG: capsular polysaccharide biosynthesis protein CapF, partial [Oscillospiraceae bacterium]